MMSNPAGPIFAFAALGLLLFGLDAMAEKPEEGGAMVLFAVVAAVCAGICFGKEG